MPSEKKISGVCAGIARYLEVDVTLIRLLALTVLILSGGVAAVAYIGAIWIMPVYPERPVRGALPTPAASTN